MKLIVQWYLLGGKFNISVDIEWIILKENAKEEVKCCVSSDAMYTNLSK